jgi:hypothetical protein
LKISDGVQATCQPSASCRSVIVLSSVIGPTRADCICTCTGICDAPFAAVPIVAFTSANPASSAMPW